MLNLKHILKGLTISLIGLSLVTLSSPTFAFETEAMGNLTTVSNTKKLKTYLKEGANLSSYKSVTIEPVVATFKEGWQKKYNQTHRELSRKIKDEDVLTLTGRIEKQFQISFPDYLNQQANLELVNTPNRNTLRLKPVITDLVINGPDIQGNTASVVMTRQAGSATLTLEVYDASSNVLLAKLISKEETFDYHEMTRTNRVTNNSDFKRIYKRWANDLVKLMK
ncbi:MAG: hypothetical protein ACI9IA_002495 [Enterobacterales bacterium]|jgi:hypothetical protein